MTKSIQATCEAGVVKIGTVTVPGVIILSEGVGASEGLLFIDQDKAYYIAKSSPDLELTLDKSIEALSKISETLTKVSTMFTSIGAGMTGPTTAPPPTLATDVADIVTKVSALEASITELETLKGELI